MIALPSVVHVGCASIAVPVAVPVAVFAVPVEGVAVPPVSRVATCSTPSFAIHSDVSDSARSRLEAKTIHVPSGEIAGCVSRAGPRAGGWISANWRSPRSSIATSRAPEGARSDATIAIRSGSARRG